jgi:hypothetical protein
MMNAECPSCGNPISSTARFCGRCGATISMGAGRPMAGTATVAGPFQPLAEQAETGWAPSPAVPTGTVTRWRARGDVSVGGLGEYIDGWKDVLEGMASHAQQVATAFEEQVEQRQPPADWDRVTLSATAQLVSDQRPYRLLVARTGATVAVYVGRFGNDLHVGWDLFVKPLWSWLTFLILFGIALFLSFLTNSASNLLPAAFLGGAPRVNWLSVILGALPTFLTLVVLLAIWGKLQRGSFRAPFTRDLHFFEGSDIGALTIQIDKALRRAVDTAGLDASLLRTKEQFRAGRRDRLI